jgi:hypothetical protein
VRYPNKASNFGKRGECGSSLFISIQFKLPNPEQHDVGEKVGSNCNEEREEGKEPQLVAYFPVRRPTKAAFLAATAIFWSVSRSN